jgi:aspartate aminotransferase
MIARTSAAIARIQTSPLFGMLGKIAALKAQGLPVISLSAGEPDFDTPVHILDAAERAMRSGQTRYTPVAGTLALRQAICDKLWRDNQLRYAPADVLVTTGAKQALFNLCVALLNPGDEVIVPAPYWPSYIDMVRLTGAHAVVVSTDVGDGFCLSPQVLEAAITKRTKLLLLNSPGNPSGAYYDSERLRALGEVLARHGQVFVCSDEIYEHLLFNEQPYQGFLSANPNISDRTVIVNGVSKAYAMTGWRIGYAAGPSDLIAAMEAVQSHSTSNACSVSQAAAVQALTGDQSCVAQMRAVFEKRHTYLVEQLNTIPGIRCSPAGGAFYLLIDVSDLAKQLTDAQVLPECSDVALCNWLLSTHHLGLAAGSWFGIPNHLRISFAASDEMLDVAVKRLRTACSNLH